MTYWYLAVKHWRTLLFGLLALGFLLASGYALLLRKDFVVVQTQHKAEVGRYELREVELLDCSRLHQLGSIQSRSTPPGARSAA